MHITADIAIDWLIQGHSLLDVRSEKEYLAGNLPSTVNIPILNNLEREKVGFCYKEHGQAAAIDLGYRLVGVSRQERISSWLNFLASHETSALYCWRGGLRSGFAQAWLREAGHEIPRVKAGYKALRLVLLNHLLMASSIPILLVGGLTGVGKTHLLQRFPGKLDLEMLAEHSGSAFGSRMDEQPGQASFENSIAIGLMRHQRERHSSWLLIEDESRMIGSLRIPSSLYQAMQAAPLVVLEKSFDERVEAVYQDYIVDRFSEYRIRYAERSGTVFSAWLRGALECIRKRLGGARFKVVADLLEKAICRHDDSGCLEFHRDWIASILREYYDPMYEYQLEKKKDRVFCRGGLTEVTGFIAELHA